MPIEEIERPASKEWPQFFIILGYFQARPGHGSKSINYYSFGVPGSGRCTIRRNVSQATKGHLNRRKTVQATQNYGSQIKGPAERKNFWGVWGASSPPWKGRCRT